MSEDFSAVPLVLFRSRTNTEFGAQSVRVDDDGAIVLVDVLKQVNEGMLTSYPRTLLGKWTPNRAALRYSRDEIADRNVTRYADGEALDLAAIEALAN